VDRVVELTSLVVIERRTMRIALWILGLLLVLDLLFVSYFHVFRASYYFPDRYEDALVADLYALLFGLPVLGSFVTLLVIYLRRRRHTVI